ncbi:MAG: hypothetical protein HZR80_18075 [Candidatus Heimdallarchaeota archaeon]
MLISVIAGILLSQYQGSWILYLFAGIVIISACVLFGIRYRKISSGTLETVTISIEGIRKHNKKDGTIKFMSWDDDLHHSVSFADFMDDEIRMSCPSTIMITSKDDPLKINIEEYATVLVKADKIVQEFEKAFKHFKKQHRKLSK